MPKSEISSATGLEQQTQHMNLPITDNLADAIISLEAKVTSPE